jgi:hypothetical protein
VKIAVTVGRGRTARIDRLSLPSFTRR